MNTPRPRPALRRADDAEVHPALSIAPSQAPPTALAARAAEPARSEPKPKKTGKKQPSQPFRGPGKTTSDVWRSGAAKNKRVPLKASVPKSVRKQLRAVAKESGTPVDDLVTEILTTWLGDPRRW